MRTFLLALFLCAALSGCEHTTPTTKVVTLEEVARPPAPGTQAVGDNTGSFESDRSRGITMQQYTELRNGMSYRQVVAVLGNEGEEISSNDIGGIKTVMYQWKAGAMANMNVMFQGDKLISKAQFGLK